MFDASRNLAMVLRPTTEERSVNEFDSSSDEESSENVAPFKVDWLELGSAGCCAELVGISSLPGFRFRRTRRNLQEDIGHLKHINIEDVFVFCTKKELQRFRVPHLLEEYMAAGLEVHFYPVEEELVPSVGTCVRVLEEITACINKGHKTLLHCVAGIGRSCLVAASLFLHLDENMSPDTAIAKVTQLRGQGSIHYVKQYNFIHEFRDLYQEFSQVQATSMCIPGPRAASR